MRGKTALVCGASSGIGRAVALMLAQRGARIIALARRRERLQELLKVLDQRHGEVHRIWCVDLESRQEVDAALPSLLQEGSVQILINNTGGPPGGPLLEAAPEAFSKAMSRHLLTPHLLVQRLLPGMVSSGYGRIVNIISTSVREPIPNLGVSNTTRAAVASWAKSLSRELPPGVTINNVLPGFTDTDRLQSLKESRAARAGCSEEEVHRQWLSQVPEGRLGQAWELAEAVAFLASPAAAYIRGVSLPVDGGRLRSI